MKLAYFIMAHHKPYQLARLINAIHDEQNIYMVHVDSVADEQMHFMVSELARLNPNIHVLPSRKVTWGAWSLTQVEIDAIRALLALDDEWHYFINLSGQDFPLVTQNEVRRHLAIKNGYNLMRIQACDNEFFKDTQRYYWVEDFGQIKRLGEREPFENYFADHIKNYEGPQWKMITRELAAYSVESAHALQMQDFFRYTFLSDEHYFPTVIMNSHFAPTVDQDFKRIYEMVLGESLNRPRTLVKRDFHSLIQSGAFFARKFDQDEDNEILTLLENHLGVGIE